MEDSELSIEPKEEELDLGDDAFTIQEDELPQQKFMSILLTNLDVNYDAWRAELPSEEGDNEGNKEEKEKVGLRYTVRHLMLLVYNNYYAFKLLHSW